MGFRITWRRRKELVFEVMPFTGLAFAGAAILLGWHDGRFGRREIEE